MNERVFIVNNITLDDKFELVTPWHGVDFENIVPFQNLLKMF